MSVLLGGLGYIVKKAVDVGVDVLKTRLLKEHTKDFIVLYGPDGRVAKRVEVDSR